MTREAVASDAAWPCGHGGLPRCQERLPRRGLCAKHAAEIRALGELSRGRPSRPKPARQEQEHGARRRQAYDDRRRHEAAQRTEAKAADVAAFLQAAGRVVSRRELEDALGSGAVLNRAVALAVERGDIVSRTGGPPRERGYYVPASEKAA